MLELLFWGLIASLVGLILALALIRGGQYSVDVMDHKYKDDD